MTVLATRCADENAHKPHDSCPGVHEFKLPERLCVTLLDGGVYLNVDFAERRLTPDEARHLAIKLVRTADKAELERAGGVVSDPSFVHPIEVPGEIVEKNPLTLSPEAEAELQRTLDEIDEAHARAAVNAHKVWVR